MPAARAARTRAKPGSETSGVPASETSARVLPLGQHGDQPLGQGVLVVIVERAQTPPWSDPGLGQ